MLSISYSRFMSQGLPKRFWIPAFGALVLFALTGFLSGNPFAAQGKTERGVKWNIEKVRGDYRLLPEGSLDVSEEIKVFYRGQSLGFWRDVPIRSGQEITDLQVGDSTQGKYVPGGSAALGSDGEPGTYGVDTTLPGIYRIVWHHSTQDESIGFQNSFRVSGVAEKYKNADLLRLRLWGDEWESDVDQLRASVALPKNLQVQTTSSPSWLRPQITSSNGKIIYSAQNIPAGQAVDLWLSFPAGSIGEGVRQQAGRAPILNESWVGSFYIKGPVQRAFAWAALFLLFVMLPVIGWFVFWRRRMRDEDYSGERFLYEPPKGSLVYGYALTEENPGEWKGLHWGTALLATLLDLVARGYYIRNNVRDPKSGEWRLQIAIKEDRPQEDLSEGERATMYYFDNLLEKGPCRIDQVNQRIKRGAVALSQQAGATTILKRDLQAGDKQQGAHSKTMFVRAVALLWGMALWTAIVLLTTPAVFFADISLLACLVAFLVMIFAIWRWPAGDFSYIADMSLVGPWRAYRDFVCSFPRMNEAPDLQAIIWERAFAAATLYGVAKEFVARSRTIAPDMDPSSQAFSETALLAVYIGGSIVDAAKPESSSSSGGEFSSGGGSSGGFGGGGGGSW